MLKQLLHEDNVIGFPACQLLILIAFCQLYCFMPMSVLFNSYGSSRKNGRLFNCYGDPCFNIMHNCLLSALRTKQFQCLEHKSLLKMMAYLWEALNEVLFSMNS